MPCNLTENNKIMTFLGALEEENDLFLNFSDGCLKSDKRKKKMQNVGKQQRTQRNNRLRDAV